MNNINWKQVGWVSFALISFIMICILAHTYNESMSNEMRAVGVKNTADALKNKYLEFQKACPVDTMKKYYALAHAYDSSIKLRQPTPVTNSSPGEGTVYDTIPSLTHDLLVTLTTYQIKYEPYKFRAILLDDNGSNLTVLMKNGKGLSDLINNGLAPWQDTFVLSYDYFYHRIFNSYKPQDSLVVTVIMYDKKHGEITSTNRPELMGASYLWEKTRSQLEYERRSMEYSASYEKWAIKEQNKEDMIRYICIPTGLSYQDLKSYYEMANGYGDLKTLNRAPFKPVTNKTVEEDSKTSSNTGDSIGVFLPGDSIRVNLIKDGSIDGIIKMPSRKYTDSITGDSTLKKIESEIYFIEDPK